MRHIRLLLAALLPTLACVAGTAVGEPSRSCVWIEAEKSGPDAIAPLGEGLFPLPCKTPLALPYSRRKAYVAGSGLVQALLSTPEPRGMGGNIAGPGLHVKLAGHGPWQRVEQTLVNSPVPAVVTRLKWPDVEVEQAVFAAAPEEQGFFVRVTVTNKTAAAREFELVSLLRNAADARPAGGPRLVAGGQPLLRKWFTWHDSSSLARPYKIKSANDVR